MKHIRRERGNAPERLRQSKRGRESHPIINPSNFSATVPMLLLKHPCMVGTHWFAYTDQSAAGRPSKNYQIGFVDVTDTSYPLTIEVSREMADRICALRASDSKDLFGMLETLWSEDLKIVAGAE